MDSSDRAAQRFVRAVLAGAEVDRDDAGFVAAGVRLTLPGFDALHSAGVLDPCGGPTPAARSWLRRQRSQEDPFRAQHQRRRQLGAVTLDLSESPLLRLASGPEAFLEPHQVLAGERIRQLFERSRLRPRVTMSYSPDRIAGPAASGAETGDLAIDARRRLARLLDRLPADCAGVVLDVCGYLKGLQLVENERGWPRRSAKLVLRIGLDQAAGLLGLDAEARGPDMSQARHWGERPDIVG